MDLKKLIFIGIGAIMVMTLLLVYVWHKKTSEQNHAQSTEQNQEQPAEPMTKEEAYKKVFN